MASSQFDIGMVNRGALYAAAPRFSVYLEALALERERAEVAEVDGGARGRCGCDSVELSDEALGGLREREEARGVAEVETVELVRVRLSLQLEQAKNALLLRQGKVFNDALSEASKLVAVNFVPEDTVTVAMAEGLAGLRDVDIAPELPDISASQQAIRGFIDKTYQRRNQLDPMAEEEAAGGAEAQEVAP